MRSSSRYRYNLFHPVFRRYPRLFLCRCVRIFAFGSTDVTYCLKCYDRRGKPSSLNPVMFHGLLDGSMEPILCELCNSDMRKCRNASECSDCFLGYMDFAGAMRRLGHNYNNVRSMLYDLINQDLLRIEISENIQIEE